MSGAFDELVNRVSSRGVSFCRVSTGAQMLITFSLADCLHAIALARYWTKAWRSHSRRCARWLSRRHARQHQSYGHDWHGWRWYRLCSRELQLLRAACSSAFARSSSPLRRSVRSFWLLSYIFNRTAHCPRAPFYQHHPHHSSVNSLQTPLM